MLSLIFSTLISVIMLFCSGTWSMCPAGVGEQFKNCTSFILSAVWIGVAGLFGFNLTMVIGIIMSDSVACNTLTCVPDYTVSIDLPLSGFILASIIFGLGGTFGIYAKKRGIVT